MDMGVKGRIHSFETSGTVDGPGIRFVVFMQGCPFRCLFCHNPDTWSFKAGKLYSVKEVLNKMKNYIPYMRASGGGITVTGGEPLMQIDFLTELFKACKELDMHTAIDTNGFIEINSDKLDRLMDYTDLVLLSIKHMDPEIHKKITGHTNECTLKFAEYLKLKNIPVWLRYVVVPGLTDDTESLYDLRNFVNNHPNIEKVELIPFHKMGEYKWENLNMDYTLNEAAAAREEDIIKAKNILAGKL